MLLRTRAILVIVVGTVMGLSLSFSGGLLASRPQPAPDDDALQQARVLADIMARVKRDYVEPVDDSILLENAIRVTPAGGSVSGTVAELEKNRSSLTGAYIAGRERIELPAGVDIEIKIQNA